MIGFDVKISLDLTRLPAALERATGDAQRGAADAVVAASRSSLKTAGAFATGELSDSGRVETTGGNTSVQFDTPAALIERGRPPGPIPRWSVFEPILRRWALAKGIDPKHLFLIAQKIRRQGYPARWPFKNALANSQREIEAAVQEPFEELLG